MGTLSILFLILFCFTLTLELWSFFFFKSEHTEFFNPEKEHKFRGSTDFPHQKLRQIGPGVIFFSFFSRIFPIITSGPIDQFSPNFNLGKLHL